MAPPLKKAEDRLSHNITVQLPAAELEAFNAYLAARGWSRAYTMRWLIRRLPISETVLTPEANLYRRLKAALPELEAQ